MKWAVPQRFLKLTLFRGRNVAKETKILSQLDASYNISFDTSATVSGAVNEANIKIGGLTRDKMVYLATSTTPWTQNIIQNEITIDAGYTEQHAVIFDGVIIDAVPNLESADYSITLKARAFYPIMTNDVLSLTFPGTVSAAQIAQELATKLGFVFFNELKKDVFVTDYQLKDSSPIQHTRYLSQITGLDVYIYQNRLYIKSRGTVGMGEKRNPFIVNDDIMVGAPLPNAMGCDVVIRLNPSILTGEEVELQSRRFPTLNTTNYVLQTIAHAGDTKGNRWQTKLVMLRKDLYEQ